MYDIVIPSLYEVDKDYLKLCVESLRESGFAGKIIVVTNGTKVQSIISDIEGISAHLHTSDQGQCNAVNIGAQLATAEYLMVSNSDMYYASGWDRNLRFGNLVFSPNLVEPVDNAGSAEPFLKFDGGLTVDSFNRKELDRFIEDRLKPCDCEKEEPGFNLPLFIKRDFWNFLGGYDTNFDPWSSNSDTDLQTRINEAGVIPRRLKDVLVYHFSNKSGTFDGTHQAEYQHNLEYFKQKHGFDRDELGSDVWYNKDMLPKDKSSIKYEQKLYTGL